METKIKQIFLDLGADLCGIAHIDRFTEAPVGFRPTEIYPDCRSVIVFARQLPHGLTQVNPRIIYNHIGDIVKGELDQISYRGSLAIEQLGGVAVPLPCDSPYEFWDSEKLEGRGLISMRHAARLAGLGSLGKNTLLITREFGNMVMIGAVLTNLDLQSDPLTEEYCISSCRICLDKCPTGALNGLSANQSLCRPYTYGSTKRGFGVCNCNRCRVRCPRALGVKPPACEKA